MGTVAENFRAFHDTSRTPIHTNIRSSLPQNMQITTAYESRVVVGLKEHGLLRSDADKLLAPVMMKAERQWIFYLKLMLKQPNK